MPFIITDASSPVLQSHTSQCGNFTAHLRREGWVILHGDEDVTDMITSHIEDKYTLIATVGTTPVEFRWGEPGPDEAGEQICQYCNADPCYIFEVMQSIGVHAMIWSSQEPAISEQVMNERRENLAIRILQSRDLISGRTLPMCVETYLSSTAH